MKKILVPVDFSAASRNASEYAVQLAKTLGAEVQLLKVYKDLIPATAGPEPWSVTLSTAQSKNEAHMNQEIDFLREKYSITVKGNLRMGLKMTAIGNMAREMEADLLVMGKTEKSKVFGSTILKTIRKTNLPVMIIPAGTAFHPVRNIVLAVDFREGIDTSCFEPLFKIIKMFDASLRVLHVEKKGDDIHESEMSGKLELGSILGKVSYWYDKIESDDVEQGILDFVQNHPTDLLVMIAHQHNATEGVSGPVYTRAISLAVKLPLLVIKN